MKMFSGLHIHNKPIPARLILMIIAFFSASSAVNAQGNYTHCGTDKNWEKHVKQNPELLKEEETANVKAIFSGVLNKAEDTVVKIIPVVFHVLHTYGTENISKEQIEDQLTTLNDAFRKRNRDTINI